MGKNIVLGGVRHCGVVLTDGSPQEERLLTNLSVPCRIEIVTSVSRSCPRRLPKRRVPRCVSQGGTRTCRTIVRPSRLVVATSAVM